MDYVAGFLIVNDYSLQELTIRADWPEYPYRLDWGQEFRYVGVPCSLPGSQTICPQLSEFASDPACQSVTKQDLSTRFMVFKPTRRSSAIFCPIVP